MSSISLRRVLLVDAAVSGTTGLLLALAAGPLAPLLGLPAELLRAAGASLLPFAAFLVVLARRASVPRAPAGAVVALNVLWVAASFALPLSGAVTPTAFGWVFVVGQALVVALFAELQYAGLRRASGTTA